MSIPRLNVSGMTELSEERRTRRLAWPGSRRLRTFLIATFALSWGAGITFVLLSEPIERIFPSGRGS